MIKAVLIDDERPAMRGLEIMLKAYPEIEVQAMFSNPMEALERIGGLSPEVVFLDINMPQLQGIDAASRILDNCVNTDIVFVTAYDYYAIEAFELHALDYLLKPLEEERLAITINRILSKNNVESIGKGKLLEIKCLGKLSIGWIEQEPIKWRSEKTRELFAYLVMNKERNISKDELLDRLWRDDDPEKAIRQLYNGIYYIRKALTDYGIDRSVINIDSNYNLKLGNANVDVQSFYEFEEGAFADRIEDLEELAALYTGDFLENDYYPWVDMERERLLRIYLQCLIKLSKKLIEEKRWDRAEKYLLQAFHKNPYEEDSTELLLKLYTKIGAKVEAIQHFNKYADLIREELGIEPSVRLQEWVRD